MAEKMGILGRKLGMTRIFAGDGSAVAVTVVQAGCSKGSPSITLFVVT